MVVARTLRRSVCLLLLSLGLVLQVGCDDDETRPRTESFRVDLTVLQPDDRPVAGVEVRLHVPIPGFAPTKGVFARRARTVTQVDAPVQARQILEIYDLEGRLVRRLYDATALAGVYQYQFDGRNDAGDELLGTHVLDFRFTARDAQTDTLLFEDRYWATLFTGFDLEKTHLLGVTDSAGQLRVTDESLFPGLYDLPPMTSTDESGQTTGTFGLGQEVWFVVHDPATSSYQPNPRSVDGGANDILLSWTPPDPAATATTGTTPDTSDPRPVLARVPVDPPVEWTFHQNYPNPFN